MEALFEAIQSGDLNACRSLVEGDSSLGGARNEQGVSARLFALYCQQGDIAQLLAQHGAPPDLLEAAALGDIHRLQTCLDQGDEAGMFSSDGFTALHYSAFFGRPDVARRLLAAGADVHVQATNGSGLHALNSAAAGGHLEIVDLLLDHGADVDSPQTGDITPLMSAGAGGHRKIAELLLDRGADALKKSADGKNAADYAAERGHPDLLSLLT